MAQGLKGTSGTPGNAAGFLWESPQLLCESPEGDRAMGLRVCIYTSGASWICLIRVEALPFQHIPWCHHRLLGLRIGDCLYLALPPSATPNSQQKALLM